MGTHQLGIKPDFGTESASESPASPPGCFVDLNEVWFRVEYQLCGIAANHGILFGIRLIIERWNVFVWIRILPLASLVRWKRCPDSVATYKGLLPAREDCSNSCRRLT